LDLYTGFPLHLPSPIDGDWIMEDSMVIGVREKD